MEFVSKNYVKAIFGWILTYFLQDGSVSTLTYSSSYGPVEIIVKNKQVRI